jgi:hypothetical protein
MLDVPTCFCVLVTARELCDDDAARRVIRFMAGALGEVAECGAFGSLAFEDVLDIGVAAAQMGTSSAALCDALMMWVIADYASRKEKINPLLWSVDISKAPANEVIRIASHPIAGQSSILMKKMAERLQLAEESLDTMSREKGVLLKLNKALVDKLDSYECTHSLAVKSEHAPRPASWTSQDKTPAVGQLVDVIDEIPGRVAHRW